MSPLDLKPGDLLLIVDLQKDFCPGGALPVPDAFAIVPVINHWIEAAVKRGALVMASRDWHPENHVSFRSEGGCWPRHCVQGTAGAEFHAALELPEDVRIINKGTHRDKDCYSALEPTGVVQELRQAGINRVFVVGLAEDVCVRATALDACRAGFEVHLIEDATCAIDPVEGRRARSQMQRAGVLLEQTTKLARRSRFSNLA